MFGLRPQGASAPGPKGPARAQPVLHYVIRTASLMSLRSVVSLRGCAASRLRLPTLRVSLRSGRCAPSRLRLPRCACKLAALGSLRSRRLRLPHYVCSLRSELYPRPAASSPNIVNHWVYVQKPHTLFLYIDTLFTHAGRPAYCRRLVPYEPVKGSYRAPPSQIDQISQFERLRLCMAAALHPWHRPRSLRVGSPSSSKAGRLLM